MNKWWWIVAFIIIVISVIAFALYNKNLVLNAPLVCAGPITDCINGCWETYKDAVDDIQAAYYLHSKGCCEKINGAIWHIDDKYPGGGYCSGLVMTLESNQKKYNNCRAEFDLDGQIAIAEAARKKCILNCQKMNCPVNP